MKLSVALRLGRVSNLPTVGSNVLAGLVLAGGEPTGGVVLRLVAMAGLLYVGGMFLNDAFDAEIDARERPERPIPAGEATVGEVLGWGFGLLAAALGIAATVGPWPLLGALSTAALIVVYDRHHKGNPIAPVIMGLCRVGLYFTAALTVAPALPSPVLWGGGVLLAYVLGLTYAAAHENSHALVRWGPLLGLWGPLLVTLPLVRGPRLGAALLVGFGLWVLRALRLVRARRPGSIRRGIVSLIAGIALVDGLMLASMGHQLGALLAVVAFGATLALQRVVAGT